jgi:ribosomal protein S12 methylthiotransferase accessory factor
MSQTLHVELGAGRRVLVHYDEFEIATDQGVSSGGNGSAPEPFDLFLASIGACAGAYVGAFCRQREIPTEGIRITQTWTRGEDRRLDEVSLTIAVPASFPDKYRTAVLRAAEQCSVKKALQQPPRIETRVEVAE